MLFRRTTKSQPNVTTTTEAATVYIAEYQALRQEVNSRQNLSHAIVVADLGVLGAGIPAARSYPSIIIGLAFVSTLLWLFWLAQTIQIYRIAAYVALELRPCLTQLYQCSLLGWESYVRRLTLTRQRAVATLYGSEADARNHALYVSRYREGVHTSILLGGATPLFLIIAIFTVGHKHQYSFLQITASIAGLILWIYAVNTAVSVLRTTRVINSRILSSK